MQQLIHFMPAATQPKTYSRALFDTAALRQLVLN
jgi:hypothetical protein